MKRLLALLALLMLSASVFAQGQTAPKRDTLPDDFLSLADLRGQLNAEIPQLEKEIKDLEKLQPQVERDEKRLQELKEQLKKFETTPQAQKTPPKGIASGDFFSLPQVVYAREISRLEASLRDIGSSDKLRQTLTAKRTELAQKKELAQRIYLKISKLIGPEQQFKRDLSLGFTLLIAAVVIGFFTICFRDATIREKIFSGQAGIQFLTLFSLVIAIILFGMTGVLEGKELAALLGGISGYILGKVA